MEAKELRIGNWIHHESNWSHRNDGKTLYDFDFQWDESDWYALGECTLDLKDISPIPLTSEWLSRFGFFDDNKREREEYPNAFRNVNWCLMGPTPISRYFRVYQQLDEVSWKQKDIRGIKYGEFMVYAAQQWCMSVKYVHQLQNLYFALTGEELILKS